MKFWDFNICIEMYIFRHQNYEVLEIHQKYSLLASAMFSRNLLSNTCRGHQLWDYPLSPLPWLQMSWRVEPTDNLGGQWLHPLVLLQKVIPLRYASRRVYADIRIQPSTGLRYSAAAAPDVISRRRSVSSTSTKHKVLVDETVSRVGYGRQRRQATDS